MTKHASIASRAPRQTRARLLETTTAAAAVEAAPQPIARKRGPRPRAVETFPHAAWAEMPGRAERLEGLSRTRIYELAALGLIETRRVGGSTLVSVQSVRAFIEAQPPAPIGERARRDVSAVA